MQQRDGPLQAIRILEADTDKERVKQLFQQRAGSYDKGNTLHPPMAEHLLSIAAIQPGERCLDLATGTGLVRSGAPRSMHLVVMFVRCVFGIFEMTRALFWTGDRHWPGEFAMRPNQTDMR